MPDKDTEVPEKGQTSKADPDVGQSGESETKTKAPSQPNVPENLEGKSQSDLIKMYGELERKIGEQSQTVAEAKKLRENQKVLAEAIYGDPELRDKLEKRLRKVTGMEADESKEKEDTQKSEQLDQVHDLRRSQENRVIQEFSSKYGLDQMKADERKEVMKQVGKEMADLVDPTGKKDMNQVMSAISLERLPSLLEKSLYLANLESAKSGEKELVNTDLAAIGPMSSSSVKRNKEDNLSDTESLVAKKLGVSRDDYLKAKKEIGQREY